MIEKIELRFLRDVHGRTRDTKSDSSGPKDYFTDEGDHWSEIHRMNEKCNEEIRGKEDRKRCAQSTPGKEGFDGRDELSH